MFVRPSRVAHAGVAAPNGTDTESRLLITEMNNYYRLGDGAWHVYEEDTGEKGFDPFIIVRMVSPQKRPDIVEVRRPRMPRHTQPSWRCCQHLHVSIHISRHPSAHPRRISPRPA